MSLHLKLFKKKLFSQSTPPAKEGPAIVKVTKSKHEGNIACNEAKCVAFMLYGNRYWWKASMQDMTGKHIASYRKSCSKKMNIMSDLQTSADMKWLLLIDCKLWLFILRRNKVHSMRCSPNPMFIKPVHFMVVFDVSKSLALWFFECFNSVCLEII